MFYRMAWYQVTMHPRTTEKAISRLCTGTSKENPPFFFASLRLFYRLDSLYLKNTTILGHKM